MESLQKVSDYKVRIDGKPLGAYEPDRVTRNNLLNLLNNKIPTWGISIEEKEGNGGKCTQYYARTIMPREVLFEKYKDWLPKEMANHYHIKLNKNRELIISMVNLDSLAEIVEKYPFDKQIKSWSDQEKFKIENLEQLQNFFMTEYALSLAERSKSPVPETIMQPPTEKEIELIKKDLAEFHEFYSNNLEKSLLVNQYKNEISFSSINNKELILPVTNYCFSQSNRNSISWNEDKGFGMFIEHPSIRLRNYSTNPKKLYLEKNNMFFVNSDTRVIYNGNTEKSRISSLINNKDEKEIQLIDEGLTKKNNFIWIDHERDLEKVLRDKLSSVKKPKYIDSKRIYNKELTKIICEHLDF